MDENILAPWRDLAIVLLAIEAILLIAIPGVAFYFALRGVRALKRWVRMPLLNVQTWAARIEHGAVRVSRAAIALPVAVESASLRVRATARGLIDFVRGV